MSHDLVTPRQKRQNHGQFLCKFAGAAAICFLTAGQSLAGPHTPVSDIGEVATTTSSLELTDVAPFSGVDDVNEADILREGAEGIGRLSESELEALLELKGMTPHAEETDSEIDGAEVILGADRRTRNYTISFPARAVVLITFRGGACTGFMIGPNTVGTAGHCVHSGGSGGSFFDRTTYRIFPGFDGTFAPFGSCGARQLYTVTGWATDDDERFDYGAIKLNCTIGNTVGWFGLRTNAGRHEPATVTGYPDDKQRQQWQSHDKVRRAESRQVFYAADTRPGNSGGPVWQDWWRDNRSVGAFVIAIHAKGTHGSGAHATYNHGTRIVQPVLDNFVSWSDEP